MDSFLCNFYWNIRHQTKFQHLL